MLKPISPVQVPVGTDILDLMYSGWALIHDELGYWLYANGNWRVVDSSSVNDLVLKGYIEAAFRADSSRYGVEYILTPKYFNDYRQGDTEEIHIDQYSVWVVCVAGVVGMLTLAFVILKQLLKGG